MKKTLHQNAQQKKNRQQKKNTGKFSEQKIRQLKNVKTSEAERLSFISLTEKILAKTPTTKCLITKSCSDVMFFNKLELHKGSQ